MKKLNIVSVCAFGIGSSLILKINLENVLKDLKIDAEVTTSDITSLSSITGDLIVTSEYLYEDVKDNTNLKVMPVTNFIDKNALKNDLLLNLKGANLL
ncbi:PTS sugar transporter subunit IIB [uncultured Clostridium sp.]|jgi:PTS system ascorbate-specific IIB component|uniref:PTS sugar transporter subunit IIB n=1 Tax=uncultured Clostridium sp. TaxID=59620 RepID=UPI00261A4464|nr:PTS sugar transporter subunit IIB [uncultured Clostridium sp.]